MAFAQENGAHGGFFPTISRDFVRGRARTPRRRRGLWP